VLRPDSGERDFIQRNGLTLIEWVQVLKGDPGRQSPAARIDNQRLAIFGSGQLSPTDDVRAGCLVDPI
jgi:hypothetical protein